LSTLRGRGRANSTAKNAMTVRTFANTNVPLYALDVDEVKRKKALALLRGNPVISVQVVNEFISVATSKRKLARPEANRLAGVMMKLCEVIAMDATMVGEAMAPGSLSDLASTRAHARKPRHSN
jgi:predicted nucleic acid-binding protein